MKGQPPISLKAANMAATIAAVGILAVLAAPLASAAGSGQLGILDTSGVNPNTGTEWAIGDAYRLAFISSKRVEPSDASFDDIANWNAEAQAFANNSDQNLGGVSWKVIGSTVDVDARDNTGTNPRENGSGHPIMLIDGSTVVAANYADLWDGRLQNTITMTERRGLSIEDADTPAFPYTGTRPDGTAMKSFYVLRSIAENEAIRQGQADDPLGWIDRSASSAPAKTNEPMPIYAMSEALSVFPEGAAATDEIPEASSALLVGLSSLVLLRRKRG